MSEIWNLKDELIQAYLPVLLQDKTTKKNIVFGTDSYEELGESYGAEAEITVASLDAIDLKPRILKSQEEQDLRTRKKAEVFTPAWLCCKMNNHCDDEWFEETDVFNHLQGEIWTPTDAPVTFPDGKDWKMYINSRRLEITCGEAPYIVSRYDAASGAPLAIKDRIGILDRKLRVVNENTNSREEWLEWTLKAFQSVYGYEWQGDSLLIARINLLMTFRDYYQNRWGNDIFDEAYDKAVAQIAEVIAWNFWQMDGLSGTEPYGKLVEKKKEKQMSFFDMGWVGEEEEEKEFVLERQECLIYDWQKNEALPYNSLRKGQRRYEI